MNAVFLFPITPNPSATDMNYTVAVLGFVFMVSLLWYYFPVYGGVHWFNGPIRNINDEDETKEVSEISAESQI